MLCKLYALVLFLPELDVAINAGCDEKVSALGHSNLNHRITVHIAPFVHVGEGETVEVLLLKLQHLQGYSEAGLESLSDGCLDQERHLKIHKCYLNHLPSLWLRGHGSNVVTLSIWASIELIICFICWRKGWSYRDLVFILPLLHIAWF
jgi:hypothetical protein